MAAPTLHRVMGWTTWVVQRLSALAHEVPIVLLSWGRRGRRWPDSTPSSPGAQRPADAWLGDDPLGHEGIAADSVFRSYSHQHGEELITVVRVPLAVRKDPDCGATGLLVVDVEHPVTTTLSGQLWRETELSAVRLRHATEGWTTDDAEAWLDDQFVRCEPVVVVAAVIFNDRCLMRAARLSRVEADIWIHASAEAGTQWESWHVLPSIIYRELLDRNCSGASLPSSMLVDDFVNPARPIRVHITTDLAAPRRTDLRRPPSQIPDHEEDIRLLWDDR